MTEPTPEPAALWRMIHDERAALAADLDLLDEAQWQHPSLCARWSVREVVAHLSAAASTGRLQWVTSMLGARFDPAVHNQRRLAEHLGATPAETLARFRQVVTSRTAASGHTAAWLGEVVVHAQDIRRPLGLGTEPSVEAATAVARFFVSRNFAVDSKSAGQGLRLEATDGPFSSGMGALARGTTLALTMALAGRAAYCADLTGPGADTLRERCSPGGSTALR